MLGQTEAITIDLVRTALDAASLRHTAIANNIANIDTPGYAPARVNFEQQLADIREALREGDTLTPTMLSGLQPVIERSPPLADQDRTALLDTEVADLAQNTVQYEALLKALGKHLSILSVAISEGKR